MRPASRLLPDPGGEVVRECLDEIERLNAELVAVHRGAMAHLKYVKQLEARVKELEGPKEPAHADN